MPTTTIKRRRTVRRITIVATIVALIVVLGVALRAANSFQNDRLLSRARAEGLAAYAQGDLDRAADRLTLFNNRRPGDPEVTLALAAARGTRPGAPPSDVQAAAVLAATAADLMPGSIEPAALEVRLRLRLGQSTELLAAAERALAIDPTLAEANTARVQALAALGRRDEAREAAEDFAEADPTNPDAHRIVLILLTNIEPAAVATRQAADYADRLITEHPEDPAFIVLAAQAFAQIREPDRARDTVARLLEPAIADALEPSQLADGTQLLDILGRRADADQLLARFLDAGNVPPDIAAVAIERAFKQGRTDLAAERARRAIERADAPTPSLIMWAKLTGLDTPNAHPQSPTPQETPIDPTREPSFETTLIAGLEALEAGDPAAAAQAFDRARAQDPSETLAAHLLAAALERLGNPGGASVIRERVLRTAPDYSITRLMHVRALLDQRRPTEAAAVAAAGLRIEPNSGGLALALALATAERAEIGRVPRDEISRALELAEAFDTPGDGDAAQAANPATPIHARLLIAAGRLTDAEAVIRRYLDAPIADAAAALALADAARTAALPIAADLFASASEAAKADPSTILGIANRLHDDGRTGDARALLDEAANRPGAPRAFRLARAVFLDRTESPDALAEFRALFTEFPDDPIVHSLILQSQAAWRSEPLVTAAVAAFQTATAQTSDAWRVHEARRLLQFEDTEQRAAEAVRLLEPVATGPAASPRALTLLADALQRLGDNDASIRQLERAADADTDNPAMLLRLAWRLHAAGRIDDARRRARSLAAIEPVDIGTRRARVALLETVGLIDDAARDADRLEETGSPADLALAAAIAARAGDDASLDRRLKSLEANTALSDASLATAGRILIQTGRVQRAFELIERARPETDTPGFARAEAGILLAALQTERGVQRLRDAWRLSGDPQDAATLARTLAARGQSGEASELIAQAQAAAERSDQPDTGLDLLRAAIDAQSVGLSSDDAAPEAVAATLEAIERSLSPQTTANDSSLPEDRRLEDRLLEDLRWVTTRHPTYYPAWALLTDRLRAAGRIDEAIETATSAARLMPTDPRPARLAVGVLLGVEPVTRALGAARDWQTRARPASYEADTTAAALLVRLGRNDEASQLLERWAGRIEGDPAAPPVLIRLYAATLVIEGQAPLARELFARRIERDQRWLQHQSELARDLLAYYDRPEDARAWLQSTPESDDPDIALRRAQAALDLADRTGSDADTQAAIAAGQQAADAAAPSIGPANLLLAQAHRLQGDHARAAQLARDAARAEPDRPTAWLLLAHALIDAQAPASEALDAAQRAIDAGGNNGPRLDALGRAHLHAGDPTTAEATLREALAFDPNNPAARVTLAEALAAQGRGTDSERILRDTLLRRQIDRQALLRARVDRLRASSTAADGQSDPASTPR
ncbi:MAG: tetratricopeptide repeat protein [Planctomycetota bacterium]